MNEARRKGISEEIIQRCVREMKEYAEQELPGVKLEEEEIKVIQETITLAVCPPCCKKYGLA